MSITQAKQLLQDTKNTLIFFDNDADGLCAALLLSHHVQNANLVTVKNDHEALIDMVASKVLEHQPDLVVFLDKPLVPPQALTQNVPVIYIDHHPYKDIPDQVIYINPRIQNPDDNTCTTHTTYDLLDKPSNFLWLAEIGVIADWQTGVHEEFCKKYPELAQPPMTAPEVLFASNLSPYIQLFDFNLHGKTADVNKAIRQLQTAKSFQDLDSLDFVQKRYKQAKQDYDNLLNQIRNQSTQTENSLVFVYEQSTSFTSMLSNQILFENPNKLIVIARKTDNIYKCSLRISEPYNLEAALQKVFTTYPGEGGGHAQACGARIPVAVFDDVLQALVEELA